jgi:ribonuclease VapC
MKVVDSSTLVAAVLGEPGQELARDAVDTGLMSIVNVAESIAVLVRKGYTEEEALEAVELSGLTFQQPDFATAITAGHLVLTPGLSLGDGFCLALAKSLQSTVVTADRLWASLNLDVSVELIR